MEGDHKRCFNICTVFIFQSTPSAWRETLVLVEVSLTRIPFQSTPSAWRETRIISFTFDLISHFNPLPPHGGRLTTRFHKCHRIIISIHSLRMEGDIIEYRKEVITCYFNPLPPHGGRPQMGIAAAYFYIFQSTPSAWRETTSDRGVTSTTVISIHSLRMEGDVRTQRQRNGERVFQSTPSAWRETGTI